MQLSKDDSMSQAYMANSDDLICVNTILIYRK